MLFSWSGTGHPSRLRGPRPTKPLAGPKPSRQRLADGSPTSDIFLTSIKHGVWTFAPRPTHVGLTAPSCRQEEASCRELAYRLPGLRGPALACLRSPPRFGLVATA